MPKQIDISEDGFLNMLRGLNGGAVVEELDRELAKGVQAVMDHGGNSAISLKISVKRIRNLTAAVTIEHDVVAKHPKEERPAKAMFVVDGCGLVDQNQEQQSLGLGEGKEAKRKELQESSSNITRLGKGA